MFAPPVKSDVVPGLGLVGALGAREQKGVLGVLSQVILALVVVQGPPLPCKVIGFKLMLLLISFFMKVIGSP